MIKNELILKLLLLMAFADKKYMEEDKELIFDVSKQLNISNERVDLIINEIDNTNDYTKLCRETSSLITDKTDKENYKIIIQDDRIRQNRSPKELFAYQIIAEEWNMFREE